ncbi:hypothetical protein AcV7_009664 [Taiwanofungus camphoratus]|nr:hypothetical protein AcV7_009664 [Antrodia cinnamomea]
MCILDVGCGPGAINVDLAALVPQGHVIGLKQTPSWSRDAQPPRRAASLTSSSSSVTWNRWRTRTAPSTWCTPNARQVIPHVPDPVKALSGMRRVTKPGGIVATRQSDFPVMVWFPEVEGLKDWHGLCLRVSHSKGGEPNAGRQLVSWAMQAGFDRTNTTATANA